MEGDVPDRVARRVDHRGGGRAEGDGIACLHRTVEFGQPARIGRSTHDGSAVALAHRIGAGDVVGVVVRQQDQVEPATLLVDRVDDRRGVRRIDDGDGAAGVVAQQPSVVVGQDRDGVRGDAHERRLTSSAISPKPGSVLY
jgi:hypothetical protein